MAVKLDRKTQDFLSEANIAILATRSPKGRPQATPVWFLLEGDQILINTAKGRVKLRNMEAHPYVAFTVVDPKNAYHYVQIQGKVSKIEPGSGAQDIDRLSRRYLGKAYPYFAGDKPEHRVSVLIEPLTVDTMI